MGVVSLTLGLTLALAAAADADTLATVGSPSPASAFTIEPHFVTGVGDVTDFRWLPDDRLVVVNKSGEVFVRPAGGGPLVSAGSFPVDTGSEKGLLGVAVDPAFATNRRLYFYYSAASGSAADKHRVVVRTLGAASTLDPGEIVLLDGLRGPANHDGGALDVGPDGLLYVGVGDSGCNSGQPAEPPYTPTNFYPTCLADHPTNNGGGNGKILRLGLDGSIPPDNPLVGAANVTACGASCGTAISPALLGAARPDVFAWGFRNPWRLWVDPRTGRVWVGDVGEVSYEEVTVVQPGRHHGWPWREGARGHAPTACRAVRVGTGPGGAAIADQDCVDPVYFCRSGSVPDEPGLDADCESITGGQIVDRCDWPESFRGRYVFADNATARMWTLTPNAARDGVVGGRADFATISPGAPVSLHVGNDGALYVAVIPDRIARIAPQAPVACTSGCLADAACDDGDACTVDACNVPASLCTHAPAPGCGPTTTTTTTLPEPCAGRPAVGAARCAVDQAAGLPLCGEAPVDARVDAGVRATLTRASRTLARAEGRRPRQVSRLLGRTDRILRTILRRTARAAHRDRLESGCRTAIDALAARLRALVAAARG
jgi:glucose/arabinose dehydrogenase